MVQIPGCCKEVCLLTVREHCSQLVGPNFVVSLLFNYCSKRIVKLLNMSSVKIDTKAQFQVVKRMKTRVPVAFSCGLSKSSCHNKMLGGMLFQANQELQSMKSCHKHCTHERMSGKFHRAEDMVEWHGKGEIKVRKLSQVLYSQKEYKKAKIHVYKLHLSLLHLPCIHHVFSRYSSKLSLKIIKV